MLLPRRVTLTLQKGSVDLFGPDEKRGLVVADGGIAGWDSAPDLKVSSTERQAGNGAHDVRGTDVLYQSRVVTIKIGAKAESRDDLLATMHSLSAAHGQLIKMRIIDAHSDTFCERGWCRVEWDAEWHAGVATGTLTATFARPERLGTQPSMGVMVAGTATARGGLVFDTVSSNRVLHWPLSYGGGADKDASNTCTIHNAGTATAWIVIQASGYMPQGIVITDTATGRQLSYPYVAFQPVVLDGRTHTASVMGVDETRDLSARGWPTVPPGGSTTLTLQAVGSGSVTVTCRDTYI